MIRRRILYCNEFNECWIQYTEADVDEKTLLLSIVRLEEEEGAICDINENELVAECRYYDNNITIFVE